MGYEINSVYSFSLSYKLITNDNQLNYSQCIFSCVSKSSKITAYHIY